VPPRAIYAKLKIAQSAVSPQPLSRNSRSGKWQAEANQQLTAISHCTPQKRAASINILC
jgi:hypothetical protein